MKVIARYGIGVDTVDLQAATDHGVFVTNVPDFCYDEVSDTALSLILTSVARLWPCINLSGSEFIIEVWLIPSQTSGKNAGPCGFGQSLKLWLGKRSRLDLRSSPTILMLNRSLC